MTPNLSPSYAADPVAIGYIVLIIAVYLISAIGRAVRAANRRAQAARSGATISAVPQSVSSPASAPTAPSRGLTDAQRQQLTATLTLAAQAALPAGARIGSVRFRSAKPVKSAPVPQPPPAPDVQWRVQPAAAVPPAPEPTIAAEAPMRAALQNLFSPSGIQTAVVASMVMGPPAAYRPFDEDLIR